MKIDWIRAVEIKPNTVLALFGECFTSAFAAQVSESIFQQTGLKITVLGLPATAEITAMDEETMRAYGWVRAGEREENGGNDGEKI